ncbi:shikimate dehydrogenase [Saccharomonospora piscinae]|uniref:shikimate dehydrogenase n=1 Tax=Saccharomonospora piscinae TaxID=687388 RepID=UPI000465F301|nr:shikimate dehydrogenase [Saccharomonospora piscinae]
MSTEAGRGAARRAGLAGSPVRHSLSPVLHNAAYAALGLSGWRYDTHEVDADSLPGFVAGLGPEWAGLSVTMPGKRVALDIADVATPRARVVGAANTLTRAASGRWHADCTDVDGVADALRAAGGLRAGEGGGTALVLGAGGTAAAAVAALAELGLTEVRLVVRDPARAGEAESAARRAGLAVRVHRWADTELGELATAVRVLVSTAPPEAVARDAAALAQVPCVLDVIYHPWPTPLAETALERHGRVATGLDMLLHQSFGQVEQFTGLSAPREAMRDALREATGHTMPLPLN